MPSPLGQLFRYARSSTVDAIENFTTEAVAAAGRDDPSPLLTLLRRRGFVNYQENPTQVNLETQVVVANAGIIDLVLELSGHGASREFWIEAKVDAPESGLQLSNYKAAIGRAGGHTVELMTLSKAPIAGHPEIPSLTWQELRQAITASGTTSLRWADLLAFLEEKGMADSYDDAIVAREAASLLDAHSLYRKMARIIQLATAEVRTRWPSLAWPKTAGEMEEQLLWQFRHSRRLMVRVRTSSKVDLFLGLVQEGDPAVFSAPEPHLAVWLEHQPKQTELRRRLLKVADEGNLSETWTRRLGSWWAVMADERIGAFGTQAEAKAWLLDRVAELDSAGLLSFAATASPGETDTEQVP
jgi:predicted ATPase